MSECRQVGVREGQTLLTAHIETNIALVVRLLLALRSYLQMSLGYNELHLLIELLFDVAEDLSRCTIFGLPVDRSGVLLLVLAVLYQAEKGRRHDNNLA